MLKLTQVVAGYGIQYSVLARHAGLSRTAVSLLANRGLYPASRSKQDVQHALLGALVEMGVNAADAADAFGEVAEPSANGAPHAAKSPEGDIHNERVDMLIRKVSLGAQALDFFRLNRDPFMPPQTRDEVFMGRALRVGYEHMMTKARHGGFLAIIGESGAGKTTLKDVLLDELADRGEIVTIEPMIIGMEENDVRGKTLKAAHIAEAILREVAPYERPKRSLEARSVQIRDALIRATKDNPKRRHLLVIEEAHRLPIPTLKHLKNFYELKAGSKQLLSILLLGQPELARRLSPFDMEIREVWQRCEMVRLDPLDRQLTDYLKFRLGAAAQAFRADAVDALTARLMDAKTQRSYLYPLAVDNWAAAAMNIAAKIGAKQISADTIDAAYTQIVREYRDY
ncbi:ExeA family protein [Paraburkholderia sp. BR14263]|uniref:ExeA family protein n=1 Tax=unclassified Paraburkholderia TaxID=2615204 RepID=UPI0034D00880